MRPEAFPAVGIGSLGGVAAFTGPILFAIVVDGRVTCCADIGGVSFGLCPVLLGIVVFGVVKFALRGDGARVTLLPNPAGVPVPVPKLMPAATLAMTSSAICDAVFFIVTP